MIKGFSVTQVLASSGVTLSPSNVWNDAGTTFTGIKFDVTDAASDANSLLLDLQTGGVSRFRVSKTGACTAGNNLSWSNGGYTLTSRTSPDMGLIRAGSTDLVGVGTTGGFFGFQLTSAFRLEWSSSSIGASSDLIVLRDGANVFAQRRGTNAQTSRIYGTFTDASNYRRVAIAMTTGGVASIAPEGAGTGASGNVLHISGLPTANPGPGILWNNGGTVEVGT